MNHSTASPIPELSDADVQNTLAGEAVRGPRFFRGSELAPFSRGLRDMHRKVYQRGDTPEFHDLALMYILTEAHAADDSKRLENRRRLMIETDDVPAFRAHLTMFMDAITDEEAEQARLITDELLELAEKAKVKVVPKKFLEDAAPLAGPAALSQTLTPSPSLLSPEAPDGALTTSAGS